MTTCQGVVRGLGCCGAVTCPGGVEGCQRGSGDRWAHSTRGGEAVLMSPPVTRARLVWLLLLRGAEVARRRADGAAEHGAEAVRPKREVGTRDSVGEWVRVGG